MDITEQKKIEQQLKESEKKLKDLIEAVPIGITISNPEGIVSEVNSQAIKILGYTSKEEYLNTPAENFYYNPKDRERFLELHEKDLVKDFETQLKRRDGTVFWASITSKAIRSSGQTLFFNTIQDITERKKNEEEIIDLARFPSENPNPVLRVSQEFIIYINKAGQKLFKTKEGNRIPILFRDIVSKAFINNSTMNLEILLNNQYYSFFISPVKDTSYANIYGMDITERKKSEEKLKESEKRYKYIADELEMILDHLPGIIVYKDTKNNLLRVNKFLADAHNLTKKDMEGKSSFEFYPREQAQAYWDDDLEVINSRKPKLNIVEPWEPDIGKRWVSTSKIPYIDENGNVKGIIALANDITERKLAEEALKESEEKYRKISERYEMLLESITDAVYVINREWVYTLVNKLAEKIVNMPVENLLSHKITDVFPGIENTPFFRTYESVMKNREPKRVMDVFILPDGSTGYYEVSVYPISEGILCIGRNVTEEVRAEQMLKESEKRHKDIANELEMILDHLPLIIAYKDDKNNLLRVNKYYADAHNLTKEEMESRNAFDLYPKDQAQAYLDDDLEVFRSKQPKLNYIEPWESKEGSRWVNTSKIPYIDENGNVKGIIAIVNDITKRKLVEEALKESEENYRKAFERAEFYKDLFAHDISNILQNIRSSLGLISMWHNNPEKIESMNDIVNIMNEQIIRGAKLVSNIRRLSQISETLDVTESVEIFQILKNAGKFIDNSFPEKHLNIGINSQIDKAYVRSNRLLLDVFENILFNAIKYNEKLKIEIDVRISKEIKGDIKYIRVEFIDNGIGVPDVMKKQIFKGISNRKEKVHGMGLGLLLVKKIITLYNGEIWVEDKVKGDPSKGSNFILLLQEVI